MSSDSLVVSYAVEGDVWLEIANFFTQQGKIQEGFGYGSHSSHFSSSKYFYQLAQSSESTEQKLSYLLTSLKVAEKEEKYSLKPNCNVVLLEFAQQLRKTNAPIPFIVEVLAIGWKKEGDKRIQQKFHAAMAQCLSDLKLDPSLVLEASQCAEGSTFKPTPDIGKVSQSIPNKSLEVSDYVKSIKTITDAFRQGNQSLLEEFVLLYSKSSQSSLQKLAEALLQIVLGNVLSGAKLLGCALPLFPPEADVIDALAYLLTTHTLRITVGRALTRKVSVQNMKEWLPALTPPNLQELKDKSQVGMESNDLLLFEKQLMEEHYRNPSKVALAYEDYSMKVEMSKRSSLLVLASIYYIKAAEKEKKLETAVRYKSSAFTCANSAYVMGKNLVPLSKIYFCLFIMQISLCTNTPIKYSSIWRTLLNYIIICPILYSSPLFGSSFEVVNELNSAIIQNV